MNKIKDLIERIRLKLKIKKSKKDMNRISCDKCGKKMNLMDQRFQCENNHTLCPKCVKHIGYLEDGSDVIKCKICGKECV